MPKGWLKDLDLIQIKGALWQGESPLSISRQFLVTQSTVSAIKHGRLHPEAEWPDHSTGPIPAYRETELLRIRKIGMLKNSEITTRRGHITNPALQFPDPPPVSDFDRYMKTPIEHPTEDREYTREEQIALWPEVKAYREKEDREREEQLEKERLEARAAWEKEKREERREYRNRPKPTKEQRLQEKREEDRNKAINNLWDEKGFPVLENFMKGELTDAQIRQVVKDRGKWAKVHIPTLETFIKQRKEELKK